MQFYNYDEYIIDGWDIFFFKQTKDNIIIVFTNNKFLNHIAIFDKCLHSQMIRLTFYKYEKEKLDNISKDFVSIIKKIVLRDDLPSGIPALIVIDSKTNELIIANHYKHNVNHCLTGPAMYSRSFGFSYFVEGNLVSMEEINTFNLKKMVHIGSKNINIEQFNREIEIELIKLNKILNINFENLYKLIEFCKIQ